jgi:hypothetical protein
MSHPQPLQDPHNPNGNSRAGERTCPENRTETRAANITADEIGYAARYFRITINVSRFGNTAELIGLGYANGARRAAA